jgi:hypothetical protein
MIRFCCWCCAAFLAVIGVIQIKHGMSGVPLILGALLIISSEPIFSWLGYIKKNSGNRK